MLVQGDSKREKLTIKTGKTGLTELTGFGGNQLWQRESKIQGERNCIDEQNQIGPKIVKVEKFNTDAEAYYSYEGPPRIVVYQEPGTTNTTVVLRLLHEIGHHLDRLHCTKEFLAAEKVVIDLEINGGKLNKRQREVIWASECRATGYMDKIAADLCLSIPIYKVRAEAEYDRWAAWQFFQTNSWPSVTMHRAYVAALSKFFKSEGSKHG